jgi:flavin-dependent dehydrogenase
LERGVRIQEGCRVQDVTLSRDRVRVRTAGATFEADCVVGADGVGSIVRRALGIEATPYLAQAIEVDTEPVSGDVPPELLLFDVSDRRLKGYYWDFPTVVGGSFKVCRGVYYLKPQDSADKIEIKTVLEMKLASMGLDLRHYAQKRYAERGFHRSVPIARPRALLVGEAAGIDPVTGEGIAQAIQYGATAGRYLARKLRERNLEFADWPRAVRSASVGRDLLIRTLAVDLFYGRHRPNVERFLLETPEFIEVGLSHFSGRRWAPRATARGALSALQAAFSAVVTGGSVATATG